MFRLTLATLACLAAPAWADRIEAHADCAATETDLRFTCTFTLSRPDGPVDGAAFTVRPDMPSMPMAHNLLPVPAEPTDTPGSYTAVLDLQMHGGWTLTLDVTAPRRDRIVLPYMFEAKPTGGQDADHKGHANPAD